MKKVIYIIGPSSTGKTTLCEILAGKLGLESAAYVKEVARRVVREKGYSRETIANIQMQLDIMHCHLEEEARAIGSADLVLCDRSGIDPIVYAILTASSSAEAEERRSRLAGQPIFQDALNRYRDNSSIFILLAPVKEWLVDDGVRYTENQEACMEIYSHVLKDLGISYRVIGADCQFFLERMIRVLGFAML